MQNHDEIVRASLSEIPECVASWIIDDNSAVKASSAVDGAADFLCGIEDASILAMSGRRWHEKTGGVVALGINEEVLQTTTKFLSLTRYFERLGYAHTVVMKKSGNAGFARIKMKQYADALRRRTK